MVHQTFLDLGDHQKIPAAVRKVADSLELPPLQSSAVLCLAWRFYRDILVDRELYKAVRMLLPDRSVWLYDEAVDLLADRFFYVHRGVYDKERSRHARCVHTVETLAPLMPST